MSKLNDNNVQYVPILKGKMGEFGALRELDPSVRSSRVVAQMATRDR